ncbi:SDR family NAD(P)-dependent oxidoreductase [Actinokineospora inagensis]|uniref:SDR family NAD(P)-dependent oxidoreductase n=1 Tax=Actinokineospora inagensis TaxID=103730 RepID=UPI0003FDCB8B|nr:SDR family oxidoreductase [Actinokineospora inagensis]
MAQHGPLAGSVAFVTGGSRGIGAAIARHLARAGADVALTYNTNAALADAVADEITALGRRALTFKTPTADRESVATAVTSAAGELGGLDILVNNAGLGRGGHIADVTDADLDELLDVNVRAVFIGTRAALPVMRDGGRVITIGSNLAEKVFQPGYALYAMTKSALLGFTKGLAHDVAPRRITANLVQPGSTDTDMNPATGPAAEAQRGRSALGYYGSADDIAGAVTFLASPAAGHITGTTLTIDGGQLA